MQWPWLELPEADLVLIQIDPRAPYQLYTSSGHQRGFVAFLQPGQKDEGARQRSRRVQFRRFDPVNGLKAKEERAFEKYIDEKDAEKKQAEYEKEKEKLAKDEKAFKDRRLGTPADEGPARSEGNTSRVVEPGVAGRASRGWR